MPRHSRRTALVWCSKRLRTSIRADPLRDRESRRPVPRHAPPFRPLRRAMVCLTKSLHKRYPSCSLLAHLSRKPWPPAFKTCTEYRQDLMVLNPFAPDDALDGNIISSGTGVGLNLVTLMAAMPCRERLVWRELGCPEPVQLPIKIAGQVVLATESTLLTLNEIVFVTMSLRRFTCLHRMTR